MRLASALIIACLVCACRPVSSKAEDQYPQLRSLEWLLGSWEASAVGRPAEAGKLQVEEWRRLNDSSFTGRSYLLTTGKPDTTFFETIRLQEDSRGLHYIVQLSDQNGGKPVTFSRADTGAVLFTFVNPMHDFPQRLSYRSLSKDSAVATVGGTTPSGKTRMVEIALRRMP